MMGWRRALIVACWLAAYPPLAAADGGREDAWWQDDFEERALAVNEGELEFLAEPPGQPVHHHDNRLTVTAASLEDGWVGLDQCHRNLDPVRRAEVVFGEGRIRGLEVVSSERIGRAWVEGASVQLEDVRKGARLCLRAESRALHPTGDGLVLQNGPYMRRFLDGYYPMHVTIRVELPPAVAVGRIEPPAQPGLRIEQEGRRLHLDAWFEGRLVTRIHLRPQ